MSSLPTFATPTFADVQAAARRLEGVTIRTPLLENERVNRKLGGRLFLKAECLQRTGSFKLRGAYNFLASMSEADRARGVVGWSSGNHAQGLAEAARLLGTKATIVMPADAPALKVANTRASGAEVVLYDRVKDSREEIGQGIAAKTGATIVPPYDHPWILTGQGTAGLEIAEQATALGVTLDAVAAPCSGGGLATGVALGVKGVSPTTTVHAGEPAGFDDLARSLAAGTKQKNEKLSGSICDALLAPTPGDVTFPLAQRLLGAGLVVTDEEVLDAMELAFREFKLVVEPGGAVALAAALTGKLPVKGRAVAVVCSGGNVDHATFKRALERMPNVPA
jgi:threonine dehydratase